VTPAGFRDRVSREAGSNWAAPGIKERLVVKRAGLSTRWTAAAVFVYGTLVAAAFAFLVYQRQGVIDPAVDLNGFGGIARNLANGDGFSGGNGPTIRRAPLYPLLGGALLAMFSVDTPGMTDAVYYRPIIIANCVILGLTCLAVWMLARRLFDAGTAIVGAVICPLIPQSLRYVGMTEVETLMGLCIALLALSSHALAERPAASTGAGLGVSAALATLAKPIALLYPAVFLPLAFWQWRLRRVPYGSAAAATLSAVACFVVLLAPWMIRNHVVTNGQFKGISGNAPGEFLRGYINAQSKYFLLRQDFGGSGPGEKWDPEANAWEGAFLASHGLPFYQYTRHADRSLTMVPTPPPGYTSALFEVEKDRIEGAEMKRRLLHEPAGFLRKFAIQTATFWYIVETRSRSLLVGGIALGVLLLSALGARRAYVQGAIIWPILLVVVYFNAMYAAFLAMARYSMPLFPTLSVAAAGGIVWLVSRGEKRLPLLGRTPVDRIQTLVGG
jgi:4-amino-4-deoxy-L-arabinose transferase-like glycosyltransferase